MFILCCSIALCLHKFEKRWQNYTYFHKLPNFFVSFLHFHSTFPFFLFTISRILCNFASESIKSSHLRMDSPTERAARAEPNIIWALPSRERGRVIAQPSYSISATVVSTMRKLWRAERSIKLVWILLRRGFNSMKIKLHYSLQKFQVMQQHICFVKFALRFADMQIPKLVTVFNA